MSSAICFNLDKSKMLSSGNWLKFLPFWKGFIHLVHLQPVAQKILYQTVKGTFQATFALATFLADL